MTIILSRKWIVIGLILSLSACGAGNANQDVIIQKLALAITDTLKVQTLTLTKVKTPWYASRAMVVNRMRKTIPEYRAITGLSQKLYSFTQNHQFFGGIYLWESEKDARAWFSPAWFEKTEKKYGKKGIVEYYEVLSIQIVAQTQQTEGKFWAVLSFSKAKSALELTPEGLIKVITLKNDTGQQGLLTLWQSKAGAEKYFKDKSDEIAFFDTPILLDNTKRK